MTGNAASSSSETLPPERVRYLKQGEAITDDYLLTDDLSCGSLTERLLSSLVLEDLVDVNEIKAMASEEEEEEEDPMDTDSVSSYSGGRTITELAPDPPEDIVDFEERLKRELRYAGLFTDDDVSSLHENICGWLTLNVSFRLIGMHERMMRFVPNYESLDVNWRNKPRLTSIESPSFLKWLINNYNMNNIAVCWTPTINK